MDIDQFYINDIQNMRHLCVENIAFTQMLVSSLFPRCFHIVSSLFPHCFLLVSLQLHIKNETMWKQELFPHMCLHPNSVVFVHSPYVPNEYTCGTKSNFKWGAMSLILWFIELSAWQQESWHKRRETSDVCVASEIIPSNIHNLQPK